MWQVETINTTEAIRGQGGQMPGPFIPPKQKIKKLWNTGRRTKSQGSTDRSNRVTESSDTSLDWHVTNGSVPALSSTKQVQLSHHLLKYTWGQSKYSASVSQIPSMFLHHSLLFTSSVCITSCSGQLGSVPIRLKTTRHPAAQDASILMLWLLLFPLYTP